MISLILVLMFLLSPVNTVNVYAEAGAGSLGTTGSFEESADMDPVEIILEDSANVESEEDFETSENGNNDSFGEAVTPNLSDENYDASFSDDYEEEGSSDDFEFNFDSDDFEINTSSSGWVDSRTGEPIDPSEMLEELKKYLAPLVGMVSVLSIISIISFLVLIISFWKIFEKAGIAGWKSLIPIYNQYLLWKIATGNGIMFLLMLIPCIGPFMILLLDWKLNKTFNGTIVTFIMMILLPIVIFPVIAFDKSAVYIDPADIFDS